MRVSQVLLLSYLCYTTWYSFPVLLSSIYVRNVFANQSWIELIDFTILSHIVYIWVMVLLDFLIYIRWLIQFCFDHSRELFPCGLLYFTIPWPLFEFYQTHCWHYSIYPIHPHLLLSPRHVVCKTIADIKTSSHHKKKYEAQYSRSNKTHHKRRNNQR